MFTRILVVFSALFAFAFANADYIEVEVTGQIYDGYDYGGTLRGGSPGSLNGLSVTATWRFDLADVPADSNSSPYYGYYLDYSDWILGTIAVGPAIETEDGIVDDSDGMDSYDRDTIVLRDYPSSSEYYSAYSYARDYDYGSTTGSYYDSFYSYAYWYSYTTDFLQGDGIDQTFDLNAATIADLTSYGSFYMYSYEYQSGYDPYARGSYRVLTATATRIPEPGTLLLIAVGLIGLGAARRRG